MSQYPPPPPQGNPQPYYQPQYYPVSQNVPTAPRSKACRTAAVMQIVMGVIGLVLAVCLGALSAMLAADLIPVEDQAELTEITKGLPVSISELMLIATICMGMPALVLAVLGIFVWRESRVAIIVSLVVAAGLLLLNMIGTVVTAVSQQDNASLCTNLTSAVMLAILVGLLVWALRDLHTRDAAARNLYAQWQQYFAQQQQQQSNPQFPQPPGDAQLPPPPMPPAQ